MCFGVYFLVYSGLFDGLRVMMYWKYGDDFLKRFFLLMCDINLLYIVEGNIIIFVGSVVVIDCCFYIVKYYYSVKVVN